MLNGLKGRYESHHGVRISAPALEAAARLSHRYMPSRRLPDKAIDLVDEACSQLRVRLESTPTAILDVDAQLAATLLGAQPPPAGHLASHGEAALDAALPNPNPAPSAALPLLIPPSPPPPPTAWAAADNGSNAASPIHAPPPPPSEAKIASMRAHRAALVACWDDIRERLRLVGETRRHIEMLTAELTRVVRLGNYERAREVEQVWMRTVGG